MPRMTDEYRAYFGYYEELNVRFEVERNKMYFFETSCDVDNVTVFKSFSDAKAAAFTCPC